MIIYDTGQGISSWVQAPDFEAYGNLVFNNGWWAPDRGHGHNIYTQNQTGTKLYRDNILLNAFGYNIQMYGSDQAFLNNFTWEGNMVVNSGTLFGGGTPVNNLTLRDNLFYKAGAGFGYSNPNNEGVLLTGNYLTNGISLKYFRNVTATGNTMLQLTHDGQSKIVSATMPTGVNLTDYQFDQNNYFKSSWGGDDFWTPGILYYFSDWQAQGFDINGTYTTTVSPDFLPTGIKIFFRKNQYDSSRAHIAIYNWDHANSVDVLAGDVSQVLSSGDSYELRNVQDYFNDIITGTYSGGNLSVPMTGHTVAKPIGYDQTLGANTFPEFGAFVLIKTASGGGTPTPAPAPTPTPTTPSVPSGTTAPSTHTPTTPTTSTPITPLPTPALPPQVILDTLNALQTSLGLGVKNATQEVTSLQTFLFLEKYISEDQISGSFDAVTDSAVKKYQCDKNIICSGAFWGNVGRTTRDKINVDIFRYRSAATSASTTSSQQISKNISLGARGTDVTILQTFLIKQNHLTADNVTGYFGYATESAVQKFQKAMNIVSSGSPNSTGYGAVGNITRAKINTMLNSSSQISTAEMQQKIAELQKIINDLMEQLKKMGR